LLFTGGGYYVPQLQPGEYLAQFILQAFARHSPD
jgi:hypothetical protein